MVIILDYVMEESSHYSTASLKYCNDLQHIVHVQYNTVNKSSNKSVPAKSINLNDINNN